MPGKRWVCDMGADHVCVYPHLRDTDRPVLNKHMRYHELLNESSDAFAEASIGTILTVKSSEQFGSVHHVMKMANGTWQNVHPSGGDRGVPKFTLGDDAVDIAVLQQAFAENRIGLVLQGITPGDRLRSSIQVMALPLGAVIGNPRYRAILVDQGVAGDDARDKTSYRREAAGMTDTHGTILPPDVFTPDNAVWEQ
jgi:hypothetical protein